MAQDLLFPIHFLCCRMAKQKGTGTRVPERKGRKLKKASAAGGLRAPAVMRGPEEACPEVGAALGPRCESSPGDREVRGAGVCLGGAEDGTSYLWIYLVPSQSS